MVQIVTPPAPDVVVDQEPAPVIAPEPPLRRKLPAYGRTLLMDRRNGKHPDTVFVVYGDDWRGTPHPRLCVKPFAYLPGRYDWRSVAGTRAVLIDRCRGILDCNPELGQFSPLFSLIGELVDARAYVVLRFVDGDQWVDHDADMLAFTHRQPVAGRMRWPSWWSAERDALQKSMSDGWAAERLAALKGGAHGKDGG
jgi:hypothetical protein